MAAEASILSEIAERYATALFELAAEAKSIDAAADDLAVITELLNESDDLRRLVRSPLFSREQQSKAMAEVLARAGVGDLVARFVGLVAKNRRLFVLPQMIRAYRALLARHRGEMMAEVISATPLDEGQVRALKDALRAATGTDVEVEARVDQSLIGGLVVKVGSRMVDSSIRTKLQNLRLAMKGV